MVIKRISLKNFKNFTEKTVELEKTVFITGSNGIGKSTLALESVLFALYGFTPKESLKDLPTRNVASSCTVEIVIYHKNKEYRIIREFPTKLEIYEDNTLLKFVNSSEAQAHINKLFGDKNYFQKFRIIDNTIGANFLEEGQVALKKILFSVSDETFNKIRINLANIKHEREIYNKDIAVIYSHYPSENRLQFITCKLEEIEHQYKKINEDINNIEREYLNSERQKSKLEYSKINYKNQRDALLKDERCYVCKQILQTNKKREILNEVNNNIKRINTSFGYILSESEEQKELIGYYKNLKNILQIKKDKLNYFKMRLEGRLAQKEYIYSSRDILIVKKAIEELDKLSSYCLTEGVKTIEPIINSVLEKIGLTVNFKLSNKGKFIITLNKGDIKFKYKDLSCGQKLILQIAFKLALLIEQNKEGIIIADEGFSSLDSENLLHILELFRGYPFQLLFVLHNLNEVPESIQTINLNKN